MLQHTLFAFIITLSVSSLLRVSDILKLEEDEAQRNEISCPGSNEHVMRSLASSPHSQLVVCHSLRVTQPVPYRGINSHGLRDGTVLMPTCKVLIVPLSAFISSLTALRSD